jgi:nucleoside 2-deoxyribosyltransferase
LDPLDKYSPEDSKDWRATEIVRNDLQMIGKADAVLVHFGEKAMTMGTPMEMFYAIRVTDNTPVFLSWAIDEAITPWAQIHASYIRPSLDDAVEALEKHYSDKTVTTRKGVPRFANSREDDSPAAGDDTEEQKSSPMEPCEGDVMAAEVAEDVETLLTDSRDTHGDAVENQQHIADGWSWYLRGQGLLDAGQTVTGSDAARMMAMLKMSRSAVGTEDVDHDRDIAGYGSISAACQVDRGEATRDELQEYVEE